MHLFRQTETIALLAAALLLTAGCAENGTAGDSSPRLPASAEFTAVFPPLDETAVPVTCRVSLTEEEILFAVTEPERSRGLTVRYRDGCCTLEPEAGIPLPLSAEAAEPLTAFCRVLTGEGRSLRVSDDGTQRLAETEGGVLHFTPDGTPCAAEAPAADGTLRTVVISDWAPS